MTDDPIKGVRKELREAIRSAFHWSVVVFRGVIPTGGMADLNIEILPLSALSRPDIFTFGVTRPAD